MEAFGSPEQHLIQINKINSFFSTIKDKETDRKSYKKGFKCTVALEIWKKIAQPYKKLGQELVFYVYN